MRQQISLMLQKNAITELGASRFPRILLQRIPGTQSFRRVASSARFNTNIQAPHFHMFTTSSVLSTIRKGNYAFNRSAGCVLSRTNTSEQQEVSQVCLRKQSLSIPSTSLRSKHGPSGSYSFGAYRNRLPPSSGDFGYSIPRRLVS